jgi:hypothetical protein
MKSLSTYEELLQMEDGEKAIEILFERAKQNYEDLFHEMAGHEDLQQKNGIPPSDCGELFLGEKGKNSLSLYLQTLNVLGREEIIKSHDNLFFNPMFYKFCSDYKKLH